MFQATMCPSSGELTVSMRHRYFSLQTRQPPIQCFIPQAVNTVWCSWGWAKLSTETCWADWNY